MTAVGDSVRMGQPVRERTGAFVARLGGRRFRCRMYVAVAALMVVAAFVAMVLKARFVKQSGFNFVVSDARMYYAYLPSVVIDHDLDFYNQIKDHWGEEFRPVLLEDRTAAGYVKNKYPVGVPLTIAPAFIVAHGVSLLLYAATGSRWFVPDGYSLAYQSLCVVWVMGLGLLSMILIDGLLERHFRTSGAAIFAAVVTYWLGTNYAWYYFREPLMAHVIDAFWASVALVLVDGIEVDARRGRVAGRRVALLVLCGATMAVCRLSNFFIIPVFLYAVYAVVRHRVALKFAAWFLASTPLLFPLALQAYVWGVMSGTWAPKAAPAPAPLMRGGGELPVVVQVVTSYEQYENFYWWKPALLQTMLSSRHGLLFWSPILALSITGLGWHFWRRGGWRDGLFLSLLLSGLILWYVNSAWYAWWFGDAYGARAFIELAALFIVGLAFGFEFVWRLGAGWRKAAVVFASACVVLNAVAMCLFMLNKLTRNDYMLPWF